MNVRRICSTYVGSTFLIDFIFGLMNERMNINVHLCVHMLEIITFFVILPLVNYSIVGREYSINHRIKDFHRI